MEADTPSQSPKVISLGRAFKYCVDYLECKLEDLQSNIVEQKDRDKLVSLYEMLVESDNVGNDEKSSDLEQEIKDFLTEKNCIKQGIILETNDDWIYKFDLVKNYCNRVYSIPVSTLNMLDDTEKYKLVQLMDYSVIKGDYYELEEELRNLNLLLSAPLYFDNENYNAITSIQLKEISQLVYPYSYCYNQDFSIEDGRNVLEHELMNIFADGDLINGMEVQDAFIQIFDKYNGIVYDEDADNKKRMEIMKLCYDMRIVDTTSYNNYLSFVQEEFKHYV